MEENKKDLVKLRAKLDKAIDNGDMTLIDTLMNEILSIEKISIEPVSPFEFAETVKNIKKEKDGFVMKRKFKFTKTAAIAAAITVIAVSGVSGAMILNSYSFGSGDKFYTVSSDQELDQNSLNAIAEEMDKSINRAENKLESKSVNFKSVEEAEKYFDMNIKLPDIMPDLKLSELKGERTEIGENASKGFKDEIWATYGNPNEKAFGFTVIRLNSDKDVIYSSRVDMDEGSMDKYISSKGYEFTKINESDESGEKTANIYIINKDNYKYSLAFFGFDESEALKIVDSLNLE